MKKRLFSALLIVLLFSSCCLEKPENATQPPVPDWLNHLEAGDVMVTFSDGYIAPPYEAAVLQRALLEAQYTSAEEGGEAFFTLTLADDTQITVDVKDSQIILNDAEEHWYAKGEKLQKCVNEYLKEKNIRFADAIFSGLDDMQGETKISLYHIAGEYEPHTDNTDETAELCRGWVSRFDWTELTSAPGNIRESAEYFITLSSQDRQIQYTFFSGTEGYVCVKEEQTESWYSGTSGDSRYTVALMVHEFYDRLAPFSPMNTPFAPDADPKSAAQTFASEIFRDYMLGWPPGGIRSNTDYKLLSFEILDISGDGCAVLADFGCAFKPEFYEQSAFWAGNTIEGEGELSGWLKFTRQFILEYRDGYWSCTTLGSGGYTLPEI